MDVKEILSGVSVEHLQGETNCDVSNICHKAQECSLGSLFVAIRGAKSDGHDFIEKAIANGARFIMHETDFVPALGITAIKVMSSRTALGVIAKNFYHDPSSKLTVIGVTGTNGKTTTTYLIESILQMAGKTVGVIGTVNYRYNGETYPAINTTPDSLELQRILYEMHKTGVDCVVMEVSSHALDMKRVDECNFDVGIFTNLTQDHLDYHHTMEKYYQAKKRLFNELLQKRTHCDISMVINMDDEFGARLAQEVVLDNIGYSVFNKQCSVCAQNIEETIDGIKAEISSAKGVFAIHSSLIGRHNLMNILSAVSACLALHVPIDAIQKGVSALKNVPGRLERVCGVDGKQPTVFIDYAHTPDALERVIDHLLLFKKRRIITAFGCGGNRDCTKRPLMGKIATERSDITIITSDNPRDEEPNEIIREICKGISSDIVEKECDEETLNGNKFYMVITDRAKAIVNAISIATDEDIVLIAGKGHENYQEEKGQRFFFDDKIVSADALRMRSGYTNIVGMEKV